PADSGDHVAVVGGACGIGVGTGRSAGVPGARDGRRVVLCGVRPGLSAARPRTAARLAAPGHLSVPDGVVRLDAADEVSGARSEGDPGPVGGTARAIHGAVRAIGDRLVAGGESAGGGGADGPELG